jgi:hypothetical protein
MQIRSVFSRPVRPFSPAGASARGLGPLASLRANTIDGAISSGVLAADTRRLVRMRVEAPVGGIRTARFTTGSSDQGVDAEADPDRYDSSEAADLGLTDTYP